jgi:hypothetical protein
MSGSELHGESSWLCSRVLALNLYKLGILAPGASVDVKYTINGHLLQIYKVHMVPLITELRSES